MTANLRNANLHCQNIKKNSMIIQNAENFHAL